METIEMSRHAFASSHLPHRASLRRFPQRSQSLRVKSSSPSISRMAPRWNGAPSSTTIMPTSRLLLTGKCLIVQDSGASSSSTHPEASFSKPILTSGPGGFQGKTTTTSQEQPQPSRASLPYTSVTLQRTRSSANSSSSVALTRRSASQTSTLFVNCSLPPNTISASLDRNVQGDPVDGSSPTTKSSPLGGENLLTCSTFSEDTTSDEGVLTSFTEDYLEESEEEDEEEYLKLETVFHSGHGYGNGGSCGEHSHRRVHLLRHAHLGLGLSITGGSEDALPVTVASVKADSPADRCHLIYVGDQIVSVNEVTLDETICHADARRLLAECGDKVCLVLKHSQAVSSFRRRWRRRKRMPAQKPLADSQTTVDSSGKSSGGAQEQVDNPSNPTTGQDSPWRPLGRSSSVSSFGSSQPFDLFLGGITRYVTYSNQLRDCSFEVRTGSCSTATPLVVQCSNEDICTQWMDAIKGAIDSLTEEYMSFFNGQYPQREHIFYMGWVSECITPDGSSHLLSPTQHHLASRWLSRYLIIKGGTVYLFKVPPISLLRSTKGRLVASSRRNHSGSSGTSLGSVGSSASEATTSSSSSSSTGSAHFSLSHASESNDRLASGRPGRRGGQSERVQRINRDLDRQLAAEAMETLACYKTDFRTVHLKEALASGLKGHVFQLNSGTTPATTKKRFFSTENAANLASLQQAWTRANYHSVIHFKTKTFTVVLEEENVFGSLILDWRFGFSFYDPKRKQYLWSYKFHQLRSSFDDGQSRLSLTFAVDGSPEQTRTHVLQSAALPVLLCCTEAFLAAKVYTLCL